MVMIAGERWSIGLILAVLSWVLIVWALTGAEIAWPGFAAGIALFGKIAAFGLLVRMRGHAPHLASMLVVIGLFPVFASVLSVATMLAFPLQRPLIDDQLFAIDALFGYNWDAAVTALAEYPRFSALLSKIYLSSFPQLLVLAIYLGLTRRVTRMYHLLLTGMIAAVMTLAFWLLWPSFGPSAYLSLPQEVIEATGLVVTPDYGAVLMHFGEHGVGRIESHLVLGSVAFPSYHMVMALMVVVFARGTWLFWPALAVNLLMIPATLTHGGHHLIDLPGGLIAFVLAAMLAARLLQQERAPMVRADANHANA